eukprot:6108362-Prymnesium_polylepis.1
MSEFVTCCTGHALPHTTWMISEIWMKRTCVCTLCVTASSLERQQVYRRGAQGRAGGAARRTTPACNGAGAAPRGAGALRA